VLSSCGTNLGTLDVPQIGAWGSVATSDPIIVHLTPGIQVIRVTVGAQDFADFDSITFELADGTPGAGGSSSGGASSGGASSGGASSGGSGTGGSGDLPKFVGNITTNNSVDTDGLVYSTYWDQITPENAGKWGSVQSSATSGRNWSTLDAIYDYAEAKGIIFKQHAFVWGAQQPSGSLSAAQVESWIEQFCDRYPNTPLIDVVNEPPPHTEPSYSGALGGGTNSTWQWIIQSFEWAEEHCPGAILILNDYNNIEYGDQNQHFINIANAVKNAGAPIHAVGAQSHALHGQYGASTATMKTLVTKLHNDTGLPVYITEYDIGEANDQTQLTKYQEHLTYFLDTDWIHGITLWGWINGKTWISNSGIMNGSSPRPAMTWLMNELGRPVP
jgi:endo-1,4-beta-xylanase